MVTGKWKLILKTPMGEGEAFLDVVEENGVLTGTLTNEGDVSEITGGKVEGNEFSFRAKIGSPMGKLTFKVSGTVDGDNMTGKVKVAIGTSNFTGTRI